MIQLRLLIFYCKNHNLLFCIPLILIAPIYLSDRRVFYQKYFVLLFVQIHDDIKDSISWGRKMTYELEDSIESDITESGNQHVHSLSSISCEDAINKIKEMFNSNDNIVVDEKESEW